MSLVQTDRFSVTMKTDEIDEIKDYTGATGVQRNELIRRATLAYVRIQTGKIKDKDLIKAFQKVGPIDQAEDTK